jgi:hypothetical protein
MKIVFFEGDDPSLVHLVGPLCSGPFFRQYEQKNYRARRVLMRGRRRFPGRVSNPSEYILNLSNDKSQSHPAAFASGVKRHTFLRRTYLLVTRSAGEETYFLTLPLLGGVPS